jgi:NagD protein
MIGNRMVTDIMAGVHAGIDTVWVLSGVTAREGLRRNAYHPTGVLSGVV